MPLFDFSGQIGFSTFEKKEPFEEEAHASDCRVELPFAAVIEVAKLPGNLSSLYFILFNLIVIIRFNIINWSFKSFYTS